MPNQAAASAEARLCLVFRACSSCLRQKVGGCSFLAPLPPSAIMDNRANLHDSLFSRNSTPPTSPPQHPPFPPSNNSSPNLIDSLFQNLSAPAPVEHQVSAPVVTNPESHPVESYHDSTGVTSVMSLPEDTAISPNTIAERQNSLLSLIGAPATNRPPPVQQQQPQPQQTQQQPQQVPTPPGSSQRSNASPPHTETQKMLEQMIGGG